MYGINCVALLDKRFKKKDETYSVKIRVTHARIQKLYPTGISLTENDWNETQSNKPKGKNKEYADYLEQILAKTKETIKELRPFSFNSLEQNLFFKQAKSEDAISTMERYTMNLIQEDRIGTANTYKSALSSIKRYLSYTRKRKLIFQDINIEWLNYYEKWMLANKVSTSTIGIYMRSFRTIVNIGIENGFLNRDAYPFGKRKYQIPASRNIKKALKKQEIGEIFQYKTKNPSIEKARDLWLFSYLCNGINIKDICLLKYKNIDKEAITFIRAKTEKTNKADIKSIRVMLIPPIKKIINRWGIPSINPEDFVFGFLNEEDSSQKKNDRVKFTVKFINKYMKIVGEELCIDQKITTYTARHSFATILKNSGAPTEFISESLGHSSLQTTANYLASFEDESKVKYQNALLDFGS